MEKNAQEAQREEAKRAAADIAINRMKNSGELQRTEAWRAHWIEVNAGVNAS